MLVAQSCLTLCDPKGCSLPGSSVHGILQARTLEWVAISFSRDIYTATATAKSLQSCPTLCDPIPGILQARTLEWAAISFSKIFTLPRVRWITSGNLPYSTGNSAHFSLVTSKSGNECGVGGRSKREGIFVYIVD